MQDILFHFSTSDVNINNCLEINLQRKKNISPNISWFANFLESQCLVDDLVGF